MVECASSLPDHCVEKTRPRDPKFLSLSKRENFFFKDVGHVTGNEKYDYVMLNVVIK